MMPAAEVFTQSSTASDARAITDTVQQDAYANDPALSLFVELGGKFWYTVNIERRWTEQQAFSIGGGVVYEKNFDDAGNNQYVWISDVMYYRFFGARKRMETGGGAGITYASSVGFAAATLHGVFGYRLQRRDGLLFRAGFTPMMSFPIDADARMMFIPFVGISLGYSF